MVMFFLAIVLQTIAVWAISDNDTARPSAQNSQSKVSSLFGGSGTISTLFSFNLADVNGIDVFENVAVHHVHFAESQKAKRETARTMSSCGGRLRFSRSWCTPEINPQAYTLSCLDLLSANDLSFDIPSRCASHEICIDGNRFLDFDNGPLYLTAYCVSTNNFVTLAQGFAEKEAFQNYDPPIRDKGQTAIEAKLTGLDITSSVVATSLRIRAQSVKELFGSELHTTLPGGIEACTNCTNVVLQPVPVGTQRVQVDAVLPTLVEGAKLFLVDNLSL